MGDILSVVATTIIGVGWGLYFLTGAIVVCSTLAIDRITRKG